MVACYADGCVLALGHEPEPHQAANGHTWPSVHPRPRKDTHCTRLLDVLADGKPHDHLSLYRLNMIVHSRVSELRKRGYRIEMRRDGDLYLYRLLNAGLTEREAIAGGPEPDGTCVWPLPLREPEVTEPCCVEPDPWLPPCAGQDAGDHAPPARGGRALQSSGLTGRDRSLGTDKSPRPQGRHPSPGGSSRPVSSSPAMSGDQLTLTVAS